MLDGKPICPADLLGNYTFDVMDNISANQVEV